MAQGQAIWTQFWKRVWSTETTTSSSIERWIDHPVLRPKIAKVIEAISDQMFPSGGAIPYSARDVELKEYMLNFLGKIPPEKSNMICILMLTYEYGFPPLFLKGLRFTQMTSSKQLELLEALQHASFYPLRILNIVMRMFMTFGYMADERVMEEMGYFKMHAYPQDERVIKILENLPWDQAKPSKKEAESTDSTFSNGLSSTEAPTATPVQLEV